MVEVSVETTFRNPSRSRCQEWQRATHIVRQCKQWLVDGWEDDSFSSTVTTGDIDNPLYSALQNQAIRNAKSDYDDEPIEYTGEQPIEVNNQNWEIHTTDNDSAIIGFPCISDWWYTPIHVHDNIEEPVQALLDGDAEKNEALTEDSETAGSAPNLGDRTVQDGEGVVSSRPSVVFTQIRVNHPSEQDRLSQPETRPSVS